MSFFESIFYMAWRGIAIGLIISAPMGPVGMLCIQRTLDKGRRAGFYTGIGAALSDLFYSLLTGFGLSFIEDFLEKNQNIIQLAGSAVLIAFGVYLFRKNPSKGLKTPVDETVSIKKNILGGFLFTFSNPLILFLTIGLFARFNFLLPEFKLWQYLTGFVFIFVGAIIWWWFITFSIDKVRSHFNIRSMWLINKIIGVIILLFAVVGIFTSVSALAGATEIKCWNSQRGFGPFSGSDPDNPNKLNGYGPDSTFYLASCHNSDAVEFRCKVKDNKPGMPWGMVVKSSNGEKINIDVMPSETEYDGISSAPCIDITVRSTNGNEIKKRFSDKTDIVKKIKGGLAGLDPTGSQNFYKIVISNGVLTLFGGLHTPDKLLSFELPEMYRADSIGFYLSSRAVIIPDEIRLSYGNFRPKTTQWDDIEFLNEYFNASSDPKEAYWQIIDRSLEETLLRLGGDYKIAFVKAEDGYDLIYIEGAKVNKEAWNAGMIKAKLRPSGINDVWNVTWFDAMHQPLQHEIRAQIEDSNVLTIRFPYQNSAIRFVNCHYPSL